MPRVPFVLFVTVLAAVALVGALVDLARGQRPALLRSGLRASTQSQRPSP